MIQYNCFVNVGGTDDKSKPTEVLKIAVSAAEVMILRSMFGDDGVTNVRVGMNDKRSHKDERKRLDEKYGSHRTDPLFGAAVGAKLPNELEGDFPPLGDNDPIVPPALDYGHDIKPDFSAQAQKEAVLAAA